MYSFLIVTYFYTMERRFIVLPVLFSLPPRSLPTSLFPSISFFFLKIGILFSGFKKK